MITRCRPVLGTFVEITVPDDRGEAIASAFAEIARVQACMSFHDEASDLGRLRLARPGEAVRVDPATVEVLRCACKLHAQTAGLFDVTIGRALVRAGFLPRGRIARLSDFPGTGADIVIVDDCHVALARPALIDLGGIAKGYAVDRATAALADRGIECGLVNAGGDLRGFGDCAWPVMLRDADDVVRQIVPVRDCALASSANLGSRRRYRGVEQSPHIGRGGQAVLSDERVSVAAPTCMIADALTKVALCDMRLAQSILSSYGAAILASQPCESQP